MLKKTVTPKDYILKNSQVSRKTQQGQKYVRIVSSEESVLGMTVSENYFLNDLWSTFAAQNRVK